MRACLNDVIQHGYNQKGMDEPFKKDTGIHTGYKTIADDINFQRRIYRPFYSLLTINRSENGSS
jgi:hypothetical protein